MKAEDKSPFCAFSMQPLIVGVISQNLCIRRASGCYHYGCYAEEEEEGKELFVAFANNGRHKKQQPQTRVLCSEPRVHCNNENTLLWERAVIVDGTLAACIGRTYSADLIKNTMLKVYITTAKDRDIAAGITIPNGFVEKLCFPFKLRPIIVSILPTLAFSGESTLVPWTIYAMDDREKQQIVIEAPENMNYVDFLLWYASGHRARIDYSIFIYTKPLLFGQATLHGGRASPSISFFFARVLSCKEMLAHGLVVVAATHSSPNRA